MVRPRIPRSATKEEEEALWEEAMGRELQCEGGGGRLPIARSALPAGSMARLLLTHIRLVEGGRLKARKEASKKGSLKRLEARAWRCRARAHK